MSAASWNVPPPTYDSTYTTTTLTPYLTLPHLLSLTWLATPIISLIFVAFRLILSLGDAQNALDRAKAELLSSCSAAEEAATSAASLPRYMALTTNKQFAEAINGSVQGARVALVLSLTAVEGIINFVVDTYRSTFLCFLELVVRGGLAILIGAVQEINQALQTITSGLRESIQKDITSANSIIQTAVDAVNQVNPFSKITAPQIAVPSLDSLQSVSLPASFQESLTKLNDTIPSVADIKQKVESILDTPFELLKKEINDTFLGLSFDPDGLPVPAENRVSFCSGLDTSVVDDLGRDMIWIAKIGIVILFVLALVLIGFNCLLTWYQWVCLKRHLKFTRQAWMTDPTIIHSETSNTVPQITLSDHNLLLLQAASEHPLITRIMNQLSAKFRLTPRQHTHTRWFLHYIFHGPALACFLIGFFGLLSVEIQLLAVRPLVATYQGRAHSAVSNFNQLISTSINANMYNQSVLYANEVNTRVESVQSTINNGVFGWVNGTTTTLNDTINEFYSEVQKAVSLVFGGTILETPAQEFVKCFIGGKVNAVENAITFLHDNLHVNMPRVNDSVLVLSPDRVDEATRPIAIAAIGGGPNNKEGFLGRIIRTYVASLKKERVMFGIFMGLWGVVFFMGLCVVLWHSFGKPYFEKRKKRKYEREQRSGFDIFSSDKEKADRQFDLKSIPVSPSDPKRSSFKPFWLTTKTSYEEGSASSSEESLSNDRPWETAHAQPTVQPLRKEKTRASKLVAVGRRSFRKEPVLVEDDKVQPSEQSNERASINANDAPWYQRMTSLLGTKKDAEQESSSINLTDDQEEKRSQQRPKPQLMVYTQRAMPNQGPAKRQSQLLKEEFVARSRFSTSPAAVQTSWKSIISPPKKLKQLPPPPPMSPPAVVATQDPQTPRTPTSKIARNSYVSYSRPPIGLPIRKTTQPTSDVPLDVGSTPEDPFGDSILRGTASIVPMPLYAGFDSQPTQPVYNNKRTSWKGSMSQSQSSSSPPVISSPDAVQYQTVLPPPPPSNLLAQYSHYPVPHRSPKSAERHRKSVSLGSEASTTTPQWRVTNAVPGDSAYTSSSSSLFPSIEKLEADDKGRNNSITPLPRYLTRTNGRKSSLNPFITPFDDEHRVRIDEPNPETQRKSMKTGPLAY